jgi:eukaryotic-like serine/threonine-protein kinase
MGSVYRARDLETGRVVALKVLTLDRPFDLVRFGREATLLATVAHPNVVDYVAHGEHETVHYLAQEWVEGATLGEKLRATGITVAEAVQIALAMAAALEATHARGIIHRDIKPANIILGEPLSASKLVDFGIARLASEAGLLTRTGKLVGTPSYMAPEQARGMVTIDGAADIWSLGCVLYEALAGRVAFDGRSPSAIRAKVLLNEPPSLAAQCPEAPAPLVQLVEDMLAKDPLARPTDGHALLERLRALPAMPTDGKRRRVGVPDAATAVMPVRPQRTHTDSEGAGGCFVLLAPVEAPASGTDDSVAKVAERHQMSVHVFDDGSSLLVARHTGREGAVDAARAALELREEVPDGAVSVFGQSTTDSLADAIDRGSMLLERGMMGTLFGDLVGDDARVVHIDQVIADLIGAEMAVATTVDGPVLRVVPRAGSSSH